MAIDGGLRPLFRKNLKYHWQSIETGSTGLGVPDSNVCVNGIETWVEFKQTKGWTAGLRPEQVGWIFKRTSAGGRVLIAIRRQTTAGPRKGSACDELWIYFGKDVRQLHAEGLRGGAVPMVKSSGGPANWDWDEIGLRLRTQWSVLSSL